MLVWLISTALAGAPAGVRADDVAAYDAEADALLAGPAGCWEVVGRASWSWDFGHGTGTSGDLAFVGRLVDGVWQDFVFRSLGEDVALGHRGIVRYYDHLTPPFVPLVGHIAEPLPSDDEDAPARDLLRRLTDELAGPGTAPWSEWSDARGGVLLHRTIPLDAPNKGDEVKLDLLFDGADKVPTELELTWPGSYTMPGRHGARVRDGHATITARLIDGVVIPQAELVSFGASAGFSRVVGTQAVQYRTFRACGGAVETGPSTVGG